MAMFESFADEIKAEYHMTEPRMRLTLTPVAAPDTVFAASSQQALIGALMGVACGVLAMSQTVKGLVETSTNLASVKEPQQGSVVITTSQRSSVDSAKEYAMLAEGDEGVLTFQGTRYQGFDRIRSSYSR